MNNINQGRLSTYFRKELDLIAEIKIRSFVELVFGTIDLQDKFMWESASRTGVNHPVTSSGIGGNLVHIKSAFYIGLGYLNVSNLSDYRKDEILAAILLHDIKKYDDNVTLGNHGFIGADYIWNIWLEQEQGDNRNESFDNDLFRSVSLICEMVAWHMGQWSECPDNSAWNYQFWLQEDFIVHLADYLSSRRHFEFNAERIEI